jgi:CheY-like chemotaxis protein
MGTTLILYIEDNPSNVIVVERILESLNYQLLVATNALTGIDLAASKQPNLILMDVGLPDIDGLTATRMLRENPQTADIPIIAVTASAMQGDREKCIEAGCNDYIAKPLQIKPFVKVLSKFVSAS